MVFHSAPEGASILIGGVNMGTTPTQLTLSTHRAYTIAFRRVGFKDQDFELKNKIGALWVALDLLALTAIVVDASTGAWYEFETNTVGVALVPETLQRSPLPKWVLKTWLLD